MIWFIADGENGSECIDTRTDPVPAYGNVAPVDDLQQDVECEISVTDDGQVRFVAKRLLDTGDTEGDYLIEKDNDFLVGWAVNTKSKELWSMHDKYSQIGDYNWVKIRSDGKPAWDTSFGSGASTLLAGALTFVLMLQIWI